MYKAGNITAGKIITDPKKLNEKVKIMENSSDKKKKKKDDMKIFIKKTPPKKK